MAKGTLLRPCPFMGFSPVYETLETNTVFHTGIKRKSLPQLAARDTLPDLSALVLCYIPLKRTKVHAAVTHLAVDNFV